MKATSGVVNGERRDIFKNPKTDSGIKKSAKGLLRVVQEGDTLVLYDQQTEEQEKQGLLQTVYENGNLIFLWPSLRHQSLTDIRERVSK